MGKIVKEVLSLETKYDKLLRTLQTSLSFIQYKQILDMCARKQIEENFLGNVFSSGAIIGVRFSLYRQII